MSYMISLLKAVFSKNNIGFVAFMVVNIAPICIVFVNQSVVFALIAFAVLFVLYFLLIMTIGEFVARIMLRARTRIRLNERNELSVAFSNSYTIAKQKDPVISNNIKLYVFEGAAIDGYALGRNTLCISSAALNLPQPDLTTLLLMKFAQFSHHDSEMLAILTAGNLWYVVFAVVLKWNIYLFGFIAWLVLAFLGNGFGGFVLGGVFKAMADVTEKVILVFVRIILMLGMGSYKNNIYINDMFVCDCGYKHNLIRFLRDFEPDQMVQSTLFGVVSSMKPDKHLRLSRIQNYVAPSALGTGG